LNLKDELRDVSILSELWIFYRSTQGTCPLTHPIAFDSGKQCCEENLSGSSNDPQFECKNSAIPCSTTEAPCRSIHAPLHFNTINTNIGKVYYHFAQKKYEF